MVFGCGAIGIAVGLGFSVCNMESGSWDLERIITHEFPLERIREAIRTDEDTRHALNVTIKLSRKVNPYDRWIYMRDSSSSLPWTMQWNSHPYRS